MLAADKHLNNLIVFVDSNKMQIDGYTKDVMDVESLTDKFAAFGFAVRRVDGHDHKALDEAILWAKADDTCKPHCIVMDTVKGKGVSFYETMGAGVHSTTVTDGQYAAALEELK